jgi:hypothetical protein
LSAVPTPVARAAEATGRRYTIVIVLPHAPSPETSKAGRELIGAVVAAAPAATRLVFFDGTARQRLAEVEVPGMPKAGRTRALVRPLAPVFDHLEKTQSVRTDAPDALDVPGFVSTVADLIKTAPGSTRLVLVGSPYHADHEKAASFGPGQVPSFDHVLATSTQSPFGTSVLKGALDGVRVDWLLVDKLPARERAHVCNFWSAYFSTHLKGSLCTFINSPAGIADRAAANASDPEPAERLEPTGKLRILTIDALKDAPGEVKEEAKPAAAKVEAARPFEAPADLTRPIEAPVAALFLVDGSVSMREPLKSAAGLALQIGKLGAELSPRFELAVSVHRGANQVSSWAGQIERPGDDKAAGTGLAALQRFIDEPSVEVERLVDAAGERAGRSTGERARVRPFEPVTAHVNVEDALGQALRTLGELKPERKVLLVVGDAGPSEFDGADGVSEADRQSEGRAIRAVEEFLRAHPDTRIVTVFTGPREGSAGFTADHADAVRFFRKLSASSGERGRFTANLAEMPELARRAILNP